MNKVKLKLLSTKVFDETARVDVYYKDNKVLENYTISNNGSEIIFDVDDFNFYNKIKIDFLNFNSLEYSINVVSVPIIINDYLLGTKKNIDFNDEYLDLLLLFLEFVEISNDNGNTWVDVTPHGKNNPSGIAFMDEHFNRIAYLLSECSEPVYDYVDVENYPNENGYSIIFSKSSLEFFIPSFERIQNINSVIIDNKLYDNLVLISTENGHTRHNFTSYFYEVQTSSNILEFENIQFFKDLKTGQRLKIRGNVTDDIWFVPFDNK